MLTFAKKYGSPGKFTQFNEWGIIMEILKRIKPKVKTAREFGAPTFEYCSNTAQLVDLGWEVKMYDLDPSDPRVTKATITPENVNQVIGDCTVLSIDTDGPDYWIWDAYNFKPDLVIIEVNSSVPPFVDMVPGNHGASYSSMLKLAIQKGYFLICHTGNLLLVLNKHRTLFPEMEGDGLTNPELYFNTAHL